MLDRDVYGSGKFGKGGHFTHDLKIGTDSYKMHVSSFDSLTSVVSTKCSAICDVDKKVVTNVTSNSGPLANRPFMFFDHDELYNSSFTYDDFEGHFNTATLELDG